ncbi:hypothetical protein [Sinorhizobium americanum]|uniref:Uncharacterized protein n=1 Tax=Sinorhizobium americanum TaxID=194963 RepID=A0A4R2BRT1_9HYPH|nr:hypothetical protein [Sinorhizobium americanum]TCN30351.1 hypothetical protein EV184_108225 [Sinorhizobium americanum]
MAGSESNPVVLDPFRTIVEVGWNLVPEYIEIIVPIEATSTGDGQNACPAEYPDQFPYGDALSLTSTYLVSYLVDNVIEAGKPYALSAMGYWRHKSESLTVDSGDNPVTITGVPEGPFIDVSPDAWTHTYAGEGGSSGHGVRIAGLEASEYEDPDYPGLPDDFYAATTQDLDAVAHQITDVPACGWQDPGPPPTNYRPWETAPDTGTGPNADLDVYFAAAAEIGAGALNFASIAVSYRDLSYSPVAISGSDENDYIHESGNHSIRILCKRDTA